MIRLKARHVRNLVPGPPVLIAGTTGQRIRLQSKGSDVESARLGSICAFSSANLLLRRCDCSDCDGL